MADGRYLVRESDQESVLVLLTLGAPPPPLRRRRRPRPAEVSAHPRELPLTRATAIRAFTPFESEHDAERWLDEAVEAEDTIDLLLLDGIALLNRVLFAHGASTADPYVAELRPELAAATRIGFGSGDELAASHFTAAHEVDARSAGISRRQQRAEELRPQERIAGILRGRERIDACEPLLLRARADYDANRTREAALQLRVGLEALLVELHGALDHEDHHSDLAILQERKAEAGDAANLALKVDLDVEGKATVLGLLEICERILRRRRVLGE